MLHHVPFVTLVAEADFQGTVWSLFSSEEALSSLDTVTRTHLQAFSRHHDKHFIPATTKIPHREAVC